MFHAIFLCSSPARTSPTCDVPCVSVRLAPVLFSLCASSCLWCPRCELGPAGAAPPALTAHRHRAHEGDRQVPLRRRGHGRTAGVQVRESLLYTVQPAIGGQRPSRTHGLVRTEWGLCCWSRRRGWRIFPFPSRAPALASLSLRQRGGLECGWTRIGGSW